MLSMIQKVFITALDGRSLWQAAIQGSYIGSTDLFSPMCAQPV